MPKLTVDGQEVTVEPGATVLQACEAAGKEIPRFCYHERLSIAGNCRMCLVEMEKSPKPIASCAMPAADNMVIKTNTPQVKKAREGVMEFLLINHPLDCPICDQGGECDLQDQAMAYGFDRGRFHENKRAVKDKQMGPLIKTIMTRCIHCTRCVRFATEIAGVEELGATGRGEHMEITTYLEQAIGSELSGNLADICPVGALTHKPHAFAARPWELRKTESVDVHDAVGSNIRIDARGREVMRILPRLNEDINEEWLSDKSRYAVDGLKRQRLDRPFVREGGKLRPAEWSEAFQAIAARLKGQDGRRLGAIAGDLVEAESLLALKDLMAALGSPHLDCRQDGAKLPGGVRAGYLFNSTIAGIEAADALVIVASNPRREAALINARIRKRWLRGGLRVGLIGQRAGLTYKYEHLGAGPQTLKELADGRHSFFEVLRGAKRPMLILGMAGLARPDGAAVLAEARRLAETAGLIREGWNGFNVLHTAAGRVAGMDLGFLPGESGLDTEGMLAAAERGELAALWLLGADELPMRRLGTAFVVYQGHHGDAGAHRADVVLPGAAYAEKDGLWLNTEGRPQLGRRASFPPGDAREDWTILRAFSEVIDKRLPYDTLADLRRRLFQLAPHFARLDAVEPAPWGEFGRADRLDAAPFGVAVSDFHLTNPIARASGIMAECSRLAAGGAAGTGTHG